MVPAGYMAKFSKQETPRLIWAPDKPNPGIFSPTSFSAMTL